MLINEIKKEELEGGLTKTISRTLDDLKIIIDFVCVKPKISTQRIFPNDYDGKQEAKEFENSVKNIKDLKKLMGL